MFGNRTHRKSRWKALLGRWRFTILTSFTAAVVVAILCYAIYDSVRTTQSKDKQVQESVLRSELADFLLRTREPDGSSLLENPADFAKARRPLSVVNLRRSFFGYFLQRSNARDITAATIRWEPPRACLTTFSKSKVTEGEAPFPLQACFASVSNDPFGRFVYFTLIFPVDGIRRHSPGVPFEAVDQVHLRFVGRQTTDVRLVFQTPSLALERYPSQVRRFDGIHEVTGYLGSEQGRPTRLVTAQAFERTIEASGGKTTVATIVGRLDSALLREANEPGSAWPSPSLSRVAIGVEVRLPRDSSAPGPFIIEPGQAGAAITSLEQAYSASVPSGGTVRVYSKLAGSDRLVWASSRTDTSSPPARGTGWFTELSDWWVHWLVEVIDSPKPTTVSQNYNIAGTGTFAASLTAGEVVLPDIAARALIWLTVALLGALILGIVWLRTIVRLQRITSTAYEMTVSPFGSAKLSAYSGKTDEIGTLARVLDLLISRSRARSANVIKRTRREHIERREEMELAEAQVKRRQGTLSAIGHEIRSPLQSLLSMPGMPSDATASLERMRRAVEALFVASTVEEGIKNGDIVLAELDLAEYMFKLASNLEASAGPMEYVGPNQGVSATFDPIVLDQILDSVIENAKRYRVLGTPIRIELATDGDHASITISNEGPQIPPTDLELIFSYGVSDDQGPQHLGLGLYAARERVVAMRGSIRATNEDVGVAFTISLPLPNKR